MSNFKYESLHQAITAGDAEEFIRMHQAGFSFQYDPSDILLFATMYPNLEILKYLHETGTSFSDRCLVDNLSRSAKNNPEVALQCLKYAIENGANFYVHNVVGAYKSNNKEYFDFCMEQLGKLFAAHEDKINFWCPVLEKQYIVDAIDLDHPNWKPLLSLTDWKELCFQDKPLINAKIKNKLNQINSEQRIKEQLIV